jgi:hypothetical protein
METFMTEKQNNKHADAGKPAAQAPAAAGTPTAPAPSRYAHPDYSTAQSATGGADAKKTQWSKSQLGPVPATKDKGVIDLASIIGADGVKEIAALGEIRFHAVGDSGVGHADEAEQVADDMATDYKPDAGALNPAFLFHLGDVVYGPDKDSHYGERFYRPYRNYPGKIIAIPGNHDGEANCSGVLVGTNRMFGLVTASQIASASAASFFCRLT